MNDATLSGPALQVIELIQASPVLRAMVEERSDLLAVFIRSAEIAAKMSSDRSLLIGVVTKAADASDRVVETIRDGNVVELAERLLAAARAIEELGAALQEFCPRPMAVSNASSAN